jgi:hypothetical protein
MLELFHDSAETTAMVNFREVVQETIDNHGCLSTHKTVRHNQSRRGKMC